MEVLLKKEVKNIGKQGDIVNVKDGFGRNYLFPKGLAAPATAKNLKVLEQEKLTESKRLEKVKKSAEEVAERLKKISRSKKRAGFCFQASDNDRCQMLAKLFHGLWLSIMC